MVELLPLMRKYPTFNEAIDSVSTRLCRKNVYRMLEGLLAICRSSLAPLVVAMFCCCVFTSAASAVNPPTLTPGTTTSGTTPAYFTINQMTVIMSSPDSGASIFYSLNNSAPTSASTAYTAGTTGITVNNNTTVQAISYVSGVPSPVTTCYVQYNVPRTNLQLWLKPEDLVISGSSVSAWTDVSGNATNVTQTISANRPSLVSSALYGFNGAGFNGATTNSSFLNIASGSTGSPFLNTLTGGVSIFAVINPASSTAAKTLVTASNAGITDMTSLQTNGTEVTFNANTATAGSITTTGSPLTTGQFQVLDVVYATTPSATIDVNTVQSATGASTLQILPNAARTVAYIGGDNALTTTAFWGGTVEEILVFSRNITVTERALIQAYFANRYQLANSVMTPAPVISVPAGALSGPTPVAIAAPPNAVTYITLNGATPTTSSPVYNGPVIVSYSLTLKAISVANGVQSAVSSAAYTLNSTQWPAPSTSFTTSPQINLQLPTTAIPQ